MLHASYKLTIDDVANSYSWLPAILLFLLLCRSIKKIRVVYSDVLLRFVATSKTYMVSINGNQRTVLIK
jgi:hypothetical protein